MSPSSQCAAETSYKIAMFYRVQSIPTKCVKSVSWSIVTQHHFWSPLSFCALFHTTSGCSRCIRVHFHSNRAEKLIPMTVTNHFASVKHCTARAYATSETRCSLPYRGQENGIKFWTDAHSKDKITNESIGGWPHTPSKGVSAVKNSNYNTTMEILEMMGWTIKSKL